ncbi:TPA: hypothetical protein G8N62_000218 [Salmonella enterica]|uniref:Uncharacterized protein n=1 Tax=Salmonella enterica TaxID=28901 RepID=A0A744JPQ6_SALER|nr:hypothetical protein [Salmonella enterica subsp. enterica serovar Kibi]EEF0417894.1 hypothetical protein [Salmonella enterica subsp. enterica serovar Kibi]HAF2591206.1 hypothetical protein [Salmonella enterica]
MLRQYGDKIHFYKHMTKLCLWYRHVLAINVDKHNFYEHMGRVPETSYLFSY